MNDQVSATTVVHIPGRLQPDDPLWLASQFAPDSPIFADAPPARAFRLGGAGSRGDASEVVTERIPNDALVEIEFENGLRFWTAGADLRERLQAAGGDTTRGAGKAPDGAWDLPIRITPPSAGTRGLAGTLTIKALRWVGLDPIKASRDKLVELAETRSVPREGLFSVGDDGIRGDPLQTPIPDGARTLILLHGTASNSRGSFSKLWLHQPEQWARLRAWFGDRIYALEHRTLTKSPIENALNLARLLPHNGSVRFLSHSRGGLVGELLCLDPVEIDRKGIDATLDAAKSKDDAVKATLARQKEQFYQLIHELEARPQMKIERFVRVACPVIGTSLAGQKLDQWFSIFVLAAIADEMQRNSSRGFVLGGLASLVQYGLDTLAEITSAVIASRKRIDQLPGLQAQMPQSELVRILNGNPGRGELFVVAGDTQPMEKDFFAELRFGLIDRYFERDHDLVVDTRAMLDGPIRRACKVMFRSGTAVNHFNYFGNEDTAGAVASALTDEPDTHEVFRDYVGEWPLPDDIARGLFSARPLADPPLASARGIVIIVPGLCGSELKEAERDIWANPLALASGGFRKYLRIDNLAIEPGGPMTSPYLPLANALRKHGYVVRMHGYDWRKSIVDSTSGLEATMNTALNDAKQGKLPVHAIVHSMGGILIRAAFAKNDTLWKRWREQPRGEARVIMLGTPNLGSHAVTLMLTRRDKFFGKLALLDLHHTESELLQTAQQFPGVLELLPWMKEENGDRIREPATWNEFREADGKHWPDLPAEPLKNSAALWRTVLNNDPLLKDERLIYIAGTAAETPQRAEIGDDKKFHLFKTAEGDGRVTWASGIPKACQEGHRCYYMNAVHGDMPAHAEAYPALLDLLEKGTTDHRALTRKPASIQARGALESPGEYTPTDTSDITHYPTQNDLLAAATGATLLDAVRPGVSIEDRASVQVTHGDLIYLDSPVMVGHRQGVNNLEQAEAVLNRALNNRMQRRLDAGIYAGALSTFALFPRQPDEQFAVGAIVIGIGRIGELSPGRLADSVAQALTTYAIAMLEEHDRSPADRSQPLQLPVSALLIGAAVGEMSLQDSVVAILRGHCNARQRLLEAGLADRVRLSRLEFVELLEDRAIQALKAAREAVTLDGELRRSFTVADTLVTNEGGRQRAYAEPEEGAWARIAINSMKIADGDSIQLLFDTYSSLARTERLYNGIPLDSIEQFTSQMINKENDDEEIGRTLFELLLPHWLKEQAPDRRRAQLVLDSRAAAIPWELLRDRVADHSDSANAPLSVRSGLVRQLSTGRFRQRIRRADGYHALVVGDPDLGALSKHFRPLDGARAEAQKIVPLLNDGGFATPPPLIGSNAEQIQMALYRQDWRVVHLSGHGVYQEALPVTCPSPPGVNSAPSLVTGMLIGENSLLTPAHIEQMRVVPDFVFLNCCSLGRIEAGHEMASDIRPGNPMLAANLATQLIEMGVRAVIAAGWRVLDGAAELFAITFYEAFLNGITFGEAVLAARRATYERFPHSNTWGAYQCYGDPGLLLPRPQQHYSETRVQPIRYDFVSPREVLAELERQTLLSRYHAGNSAHDRRREESVDALARLCEGRGWNARGDIQEAFGRLWGEFDDHERAIVCYRAAQAAGDGSASIKTTEQLADMLARRGSALLDSAETQDQGKGLLMEAKDLVDSLLKIDSTAERYCLRGSIWKRRLPVINDDELDSALQSMAEAYQDAERLADKRGGRLYYPAISVLHATLLRQLLGTLPPEELADAQVRIDNIRKELESPGFKPTNFWDRVAPLNLALTSTLLHAASNNSHQTRPEFGEDNPDFKVLLAFSSQGERRSVLDTLNTLANFLRRLTKQRQGAHGKRARELIKYLETLKEELRGNDRQGGA